MLDNREIATLIWVGPGLSFTLASSKSRRPFGRMILVALHPQILSIGVLLATWVILLVYAGNQVSIWNSGLIKATVTWFCFSAVVMIFHAGVSKTLSELYQRVRPLTLPLSVFLAFYLNFHVFSLHVELPLQALITFLAVMSVVARSYPEHEHVERIANRALAGTGFFLLFYAASRWLSSWDSTEREAIILKFLLPIWLTYGLLPFLFGVHVYSAYQGATRMITFFDRRWFTGLQVAAALVLEFRLRTEPFGSFTPYWARRTGEARTVHDKRRVLEEYLADVERNERQKEEDQQKLECYAGVQGVDEFGCQLDRREFEETRRALHGLGSSQMGWYRNRGGRYRPELIELLESRFEREGLPTEHGITLYVSDDGQKWWAYRRTVTGWCFAIGAAGTPPDQWIYDGPEPPAGFPGEDPSWGNRRDVNAANW